MLPSNKSGRMTKLCLLAFAVLWPLIILAELHRIPVRAVRQMAVANHMTNYGYLAGPDCCGTTNSLTSPQRSASPTQQCIFTLTPSSISVPYTGGSGIIIVTARPRSQASLIIEPLTNGIVSVVVTNADPAEAWTVQRSADLVTWLGGITLRNSSYYQWAEYFPTNSDHLFIRLSAP